MVIGDGDRRASERRGMNQPLMRTPSAVVRYTFLEFPAEAVGCLFDLARRIINHARLPPAQPERHQHEHRQYDEQVSHQPFAHVIGFILTANGGVEYQLRMCVPA